MSAGHHGASTWGLLPAEAPIPSAQTSFRVYRLADPSALIKNQQKLARVLFGHAVDNGAAWEVNPRSGTLWFDDSQRPGAASRPNSPIADVERESLAWLDRARRRVANDRQLSLAGTSSLFPDRLNVLWKGTASPSEAFCRFACRLPLTAELDARVEGAYVELRFGSSGSLVGLVSRWRCLSGDLLSAPLVAATSNDGPPENKPRLEPIQVQVQVQLPWTKNEVLQPEIVYWLEDDSVPQRFLAPIAIQTESGHHATTEPAATHSLIVKIFLKRSPEGLRVAAVVTGGSGDYKYSWTAWSPLDDTQAMVDLGKGREATLPTGAWNVIVDVEDRMMHSTAHEELLVFEGAANGARVR